MKTTTEQREIARLQKEVEKITSKLKHTTSLRHRTENPEAWELTKEAKELAFRLPFVTGYDLEAYFPQDYKKRLPEEGNWIQVQRPPHCEITVPPFSIWFATPWSMKRESTGLQAKRVKIVTPAGELGIMPHEYCVIEDITKWFGREPEGVFVHQMNGQPICNTDHLFYLMSRGVKRQQATLLLASQIKDPSFLWVEIAPQYGEYFGKQWPEPQRCPFCQPRESFVAVA